MIIARMFRMNVEPEITTTDGRQVLFEHQIEFVFQCDKRRPTFDEIAIELRRMIDTDSA